MKSTKEIKESPQGDLYIEFSDDEMSELGWKEGDTVRWTVNEEGHITCKKVDPDIKTKWVLVDAVCTYRMRYCVEIEDDEDEYSAIKLVENQQAKEFSQLYLGEQIVSHAVISQEQALAQCRNDNDYVNSWEDQQLINSFFHSKEDRE